MLRQDDEKKPPKKSSEMDRPDPKKRKPERPKGRWKRTIETEMKSTRYNWNNITRIANNRSGWRDLVAALCLEMHEEDE